MNRDLIDPWLVTGSALYWSAVVLSFSFSGVSVSPAADPSATMSAYGWVAALIACMLPVRSLFERRRSRQVVAATMACVVVAYIVVCCLPGIPMPVRWLSTRTYLVEVACQMVLWGFAYASFDKSRACQNVCCTVLVVVVCVSGVSLLYKATGFPYLTCLLNVASLSVVFSGKVFFCSRLREASAEARAKLSGFLASRVAFGLFIGFCMQLPGGTSIADGSTPATVLAACAGVGMLCAHLCLRSDVTASMPVALVMGIVLLFLPHLDGGYDALVSSCAGLAWLAWATMSAVQLSELKETFGMREFVLCVMDKGVLCVAIVAGSALCFLTGAVAGARPGASVCVVVLGVLVTLVLLAVLTMSRLLGSRQHDEMVRRLEEENHELASALYGRLAEEYRLSEREAQVMALLAEGYSRTHIRDALGISEGTVKAHVSHLYQKMGIHRKDELLDIVEAHR